MIQFASQTVDLEQQITQLGTKTVLISALILIGCTIIAALLKGHYPKAKLPLFAIMAGTLIASTGTLFGSTIYLNTKSESGGPVHWHADIEFWACGSELNLRDPIGTLSNKIGSTAYHEHNDKRIHLEGVVVKKAEDASLGKFMRVTGGYMQDDAIRIPLNEDPATWLASGDQIDGDVQSSTVPKDLNIGSPSDGLLPYAVLANGQQCNGQPAQLQVFVYAFNEKGKTYSQHKLDRPAEYVMRDKSIVPPGDCVIVEFDAPKDRTNKLCRQYGVRDATRCTQFGVKSYNPELCNIREVGFNADDHGQHGRSH